jgi:uncharacterized protein (DUF2252 family)
MTSTTRDAEPVVRHDGDDRWRTAEERAAWGREIRASVPRASLGDWSPQPDRDPNAVLAAQDATRDQDLVPLRHERMSATPFTFYRGAAAVMAADLAPMPRTGLEVQLCGDAHLANFGIFASPDRAQVADLNDFDETHPGPFEWDLLRLVASFEVAGRDRGFDDPDRVRIVGESVLSYVAAVRAYSRMSNLDVWYDRMTVQDIADRWSAGASEAVMRRFRRNVEKARSKDRLRAFEKLTEVVDGEPRFRSDPPVLVAARDLFSDSDAAELMGTIEHALRIYRRTLAPDRRVLLDRYRFVDLARKVVGVGSVGTRCWVALLIGDDQTDPLFLQVKEAQTSVLEPYLGRSRYGQHGQRVVEGQRLIQSSPDVFLGWEQVRGLDGVPRDYYFRQLWDWKGSADLERMTPEAMAVYAAICGRCLARAHARTGDSVALAAYLGKGRTMTTSLVEFARRYADQNERDQQAFR